MADKWHVEWLNEGVKRWNKRRKKVKFIPDLSGLVLFNVLPSDFRDAPKTSRYFEKLDLSNSDLTGSDLSGSNFTGANFTNANLSEAKLSLSNFSGANFTKANLSNVDATGSRFDAAKFEETELTGVNFEGASANGAVLISSPISKVQIASMDRKDLRVYSSRTEYSKRTIPNKPSVFGATGSELRSIASHSLIDDRTPKNKYDVYFGTNRTPRVEQGATVGFSSSRGPKLNYGICEVIVPEGRKIGSMEATHALGTRLWKKLKNKKDDSLRIEDLVILNEEIFFAHLTDTACAMLVQERPTIFIHGFNNSFDYAVRRAAQIGYDLKLGQGIGLFSWPSKGKIGPRSYSADEAASDVSKYSLADFIESFVVHAADKKINIIAHSMGCRCLMGALEQLAVDRKSTLEGINQLILAAADVDSDMMAKLGKHAISNSNRTTSYVSDKDTALKISSWLHDYPRVGLSPPVFLLNGMDTIVVNNEDLGVFSHGYISSSRDVLNDINSLFKHNVAPGNRFAIETVNSTEGKFWRMKS